MLSRCIPSYDVKYVFGCSLVTLGSDMPRRYKSEVTDDKEPRAWQLLQTQRILQPLCSSPRIEPSQSLRFRPLHVHVSLFSKTVLLCHHLAFSQSLRCSDFVE